jgi:hypothetical protein
VQITAREVNGGRYSKEKLWITRLMNHDEFIGKYRGHIKPEMEAKMTTVTITISTAIKIINARKTGIPRWKGKAGT